MKDLVILTKDIERDLLINIVMSVKYGRISKKDAKEIAGEFLAKSFNSQESIFKSLYELKDYKEIRKVYVKYAPDYYKEKGKLKLKIMRDFMNLKDYESAIKIAKGENYGK